MDSLLKRQIRPEKDLKPAGASVMTRQSTWFIKKCPHMLRLDHRELRYCQVKLMWVVVGGMRQKTESGIGYAPAPNQQQL